MGMPTGLRARTIEPSPPDTQWVGVWLAPVSRAGAALEHSLPPKLTTAMVARIQGWDNSDYRWTFFGRKTATPSMNPWSRVFSIPNEDLEHPDQRPSTSRPVTLRHMEITDK